MTKLNLIIRATIVGILGLTLFLTWAPADIKEGNIYGIDVSRTYEMDGWVYKVEHLVPPGHRYHHQGRLYRDGKEAPDGRRFNDYIDTPFGRLFWVGKGPGFRYNPQGWMREPDPRYPLGRRTYFITFNFDD